jgi:hypothetical protein
MKLIFLLATTAITIMIAVSTFTFQVFNPIAAQTSPQEIKIAQGGGKEGQFFTDEAIRQAQNSYLIPQGATIQEVQEGVEISPVESIPGDQRVNLFEVLEAANVPPEVVKDLQAQVDKVGRH